MAIHPYPTVPFNDDGLADPTEVPYPDPFAERAASGIYPNLTNIALSADFPAARVFSNIPTIVERDIRRETDEERVRRLSE